MTEVEPCLPALISIDLSSCCADVSVRKIHEYRNDALWRISQDPAQAPFPLWGLKRYKYFCLFRFEVLYKRISLIKREKKMAVLPRLCVGFHVIRQLQQQQYNFTSDMASARRFVLFVMLDPLTSASKVPAKSHQVLDLLIGFRYPIANFPVDLLLPRPEYMPLPNLGLPEPNVSPSSN